MIEDEQSVFVERRKFLRKHVRKPALWKGELRVELDHFPCRVFDLSLGGAGVRTDVDLLLGTKLKLVIDHIGVIKGNVAWVDDDRMGIQFTVDESEVRFLLGVRGRRMGLG
jgi:hypothetical protein